MRFKSILAVVGVLGLTATTASGPAMAGDDQSRDFPVAAPHATEEQIHQRFSEAGIKATEDGMSVELTEAIGALTDSALGDSVNRYIWDSDEQELVIRAHGDPATIEAGLAEQLPASTYRVEYDQFSMEQLSAEATRIAKKLTLGGRAITSVGANADSSGLTIGLAEDYDKPEAESSRQALEATVDSPFPVEVFDEDQAKTTSREVQWPGPFWGGGYVTSPAGSGFLTVCTSGFSMVQDTTAGPNLGMLFADHCSATGRQWNSGAYTNTYMGTARATAASGADLKLLTGSATEYLGVMYQGPYTSNSGVAVQGQSVPVIGHLWCTSGARSGGVCNNRVEDGPRTLNVESSTGVKSYTNQWRSRQLSGTPAAGNGDSGGPVFRIINDQVYASAIISAIANGSPSCVGIPGGPNPGDRKCSADVWSADINAFRIGSGTSWRVLTYNP